MRVRREKRRRGYRREVFVGTDARVGVGELERARSMYDGEKRRKEGVVW
jgi:hypothetical protein